MAHDYYKNFPSQAVSDQEKDTSEYGLKVARAIENEWFNDKKRNRYQGLRNKFHKLRLYARGEQSVQKYKDELSINGDLSYLNLDWTPVPIISKFVDIVVNGMSERNFEVKAYSQDSYGLAKRSEYMESIMKDMALKDLKIIAKEMFSMDLFENDPETLPETQEELDLHMQLDYKQSIEIAEEQAINVLLEGSKYDLIRNRVLRDITVIGIGAVKTNFDYSRGVTAEYVDPANLVYSKTNSPYFEDIYYVGEVKLLPINELARQFPHLTQEELKEIQEKDSTNNITNGYSTTDTSDKNMVQVLYFNYKTYMHDVYKVKTVSSGAEKAIEKPDTFNPPKDKEGDFVRVSKQVECLYEGALVLGSEILLQWNKAENMMRSKSDFNKVRMNYSIVAPRMYDDRIESLVSRITGFADMIQLTHLKIQQVLSKMVPDGVYLDADGLAEIDLGNGTNYNPQEALNMFFQTGSVIGRSYTSDGDQNAAKVPITQISNSGGGQKMQSLIQTYNYYLQMIRDVTGLNEARDASTPDSRSLVGVQKLAAANSNVATRHILNGMLFLTSEVCENLSLRVSDILEYSPTKDAFIQAIGSHNVGTLEDLKDLYLYDFGIFINLEPDEEEKQILENNIQMALQQKLIELDDAIDIRDIKSLKMANQLLKLKKKKKLERDQQMQQQNMQAQAQANAQAQQAAAQAEVQKQQALTQSNIQLETAKNGLKTEYLQQEAALKKELMDHEFELNMRVRQMELQNTNMADKIKEDRKDERTKIQASQQSELIDQRKTQKPPKNFESAGNDVLGKGGSINIGGLEPNV
tara:strand:+ start:1082 stop:3502 length:2421 start_codon:yes stop_codon:yes gene_type:complete